MQIEWKNAWISYKSLLISIYLYNLIDMFMNTLTHLIYVCRILTNYAVISLSNDLRSALLSNKPVKIFVWDLLLARYLSWHMIPYHSVDLSRYSYMCLVTYEMHSTKYGIWVFSVYTYYFGNKTIYSFINQKYYYLCFFWIFRPW